MIKCVHCGEENEPIFTYCLSCGKPLEQSLSSFKPRAAPASRGRSYRLVTVRADGSPGAEYILNQGVNTIGAKGGDVCVPEDPRVADQHATIEVGEDVAFLKDLGTRHGTFIRIQGERALADGDQFRIGHALFALELRGKRPQPAPDGSAWLGSLGLVPDFYGRLLRLGPEDTLIEAFPLSKPEVVLGRTTGDILLPDDPFVSSRHAAFVRTGDGCLLKDLGSTNGCYLRIRGRVALHHDDQILLGHQVFRFRSD